MKTTIRLFSIVLAFLSVTVPQARATCQEGCDTVNFNTFLGDDALVNNTTGFGNTAIGSSGLASNTTGTVNTATGYAALYSNTTGYLNTATGAGALDQNTTGYSNTAIGSSALASNTTGSNNIAIGHEAGIRHTTGSNNIYVESRGAVNEFRTIRIGTTSTHGRTFIAGVSGVTVAGGVGVIVDNNGQLGTVVSSERFKDAVKPMDKASEAILALKPVRSEERRVGKECNAR